MNIDTRGNDLFFEYYARWITVYKKGAIRKVTLDKYLMAQKWLEKLIPTLRVCDMNRIAYQQLLNDYAECHERQTTMDFHHQLKGATAICRGFDRQCSQTAWTLKHDDYPENLFAHHSGA